MGKSLQTLTSQQTAHDREQARQASSDKLNNILFVLTLFTIIFSPVQFMAGVYGMNFVDDEGNPNIPELRSELGYTVFWIASGSWLAIGIVLLAWLYCYLESNSIRRRDDQQDDFLNIEESFSKIRSLVTHSHGI